MTVHLAHYYYQDKNPHPRCGANRTGSRADYNKNLTSDKSKVTCKKCLRSKSARDKGE